MLVDRCSGGICSSQNLSGCFSQTSTQLLVSMLLWGQGSPCFPPPFLANPLTTPPSTGRSRSSGAQRDKPTGCMGLPGAQVSGYPRRLTRSWVCLVLAAGEAHDLLLLSHADNQHGRLALALQICTRGTANAMPACASMPKAGSRQKKRGKSPKQQLLCWNCGQQMP